MMSNFDKAIDVLGQQGWGCGGCGRLPDAPVDECSDCEQEVANTVEQLGNAGLLAPELPGPDSHDEESIYWIEGTFQVGVSCMFGMPHVAFTDLEPGGVLHTNVETARNYALKILAACDYAEKERNNEHQ